MSDSKYPTSNSGSVSVPPLARHRGDLLNKTDSKRHSQTTASKYRSPPEVSESATLSISLAPDTHTLRHRLTITTISFQQSEKQKGSSLRDIVLKTRHAKLASSEGNRSGQSAHVARASSVPISGDR